MLAGSLLISHSVVLVSFLKVTASLGGGAFGQQRIGLARVSPTNIGDRRYHDTADEFKVSAVRSRGDVQCHERRAVSRSFPIACLQMNTACRQSESLESSGSVTQLKRPMQELFQVD